MRHISLVVLVLLQTLWARGAISETPRQTVFGRVAYLALSPKGQIDGLVLQDHTFVRLPPGTIHVDPMTLRGATVEVDGTVVAQLPNLVLDKVIVQKDGRRLSDESPAPPAPLPFESHAEGFGQVAEVTASVLSADADELGYVTRAVLEDGTTVHFPHGAKIEAAAFPLVKLMTMHVVSMRYPNGVVARVDAVSFGGRSLLENAARQTWTQQEGVIARVVPNPHGDIDGVVFTDNLLVRFKPLSGQQAMPLVAGTRIRVTGARMGDMLHAETILLSDNRTAINLDTPRTPAGRAIAKVKPLELITVDSEVLKIWHNGGGEPELILTNDGSFVRVPPSLRDAAAGLHEGDGILVRGRGGRYYRQGTALDAMSINTATG